MAKKDTDHCTECGSDNLFSGYFDADDLAVPLSKDYATINGVRMAPPECRWTTFCNDCGAEQK